MSFRVAGIPTPPEVYEPAPALRERLAAGKYIERSLAGEFSCCLKEYRAEKRSGDLAGMRSYLVTYLRTSEHLPTFIVHFFMEAQGNLGASGLLDPKWIYEDGVVYTCNLRGD